MKHGLPSFVVMSVLCGSGVGHPAVGTADEVVIAPTSSWKWLPPINGVDPAEAEADFHANFPKFDYDDRHWQRGTDRPGPHGGFGYGDADFEGVNLIQPVSRSRRKSAYFRHKFRTDREFTQLVLRCQRDDAIIVYLDGKEVLRDNIKSDAVDTYDLFAESTTGNESKLRTFEFAGRLPPGDHILAISLHNRPNGSSDLRIAEISLRGEPVQD